MNKLGAWLITATFTCGFVVITPMMSAFLMGKFFEKDEATFINLIFTLYDMALLGAASVAIWANRSICPEQRSDAVLPTIFLLIFLGFPWIVREEIGLTVLMPTMLLPLAAAFYHAAATYEQARCP
jgi:hypothetical protein